MTTEDLYRLFLRHSDVTTDSRRVASGGLFFALKGERFDGNAFARQALRDGCAYAIVDDPALGGDARLLHVDSAFDALQDLARMHRERLRTPIIGITGTNGKTTTKELVAAVLDRGLRTLCTEGNLNNHIGVPLTLLRLTKGHEVAVVEMGANHPGEIRSLCAIARPDCGLITNVGRAHLEGFGSFEGVVRTKGELYDWLRATGGRIFLDEDNEHLAAMASGADCVGYGSTMRRTTLIAGQAVDGRPPFLSFAWRERGGEREHEVTTRLVGGYNLKNALAAVTVGRTFGIPASEICRAIADYTPTNNRSQWMATPRNRLLIDAYNANPSSMRAAIDNFAAWRVGPKAVILGDMYELGDESPVLHEEVVRRLAACDFDRVILCGPRFTAVGRDRYACFPTAEALAEALADEPLSGYHILIKGSHGMHLERLIPAL